MVVVQRVLGLGAAGRADGVPPARQRPPERQRREIRQIVERLEGARRRVPDVDPRRRHEAVRNRRPVRVPRRRRADADAVRRRRYSSVGEHARLVAHGGEVRRRPAAGREVLGLQRPVDGDDVDARRRRVDGLAVGAQFFERRGRVPAAHRAGAAAAGARQDHNRARSRPVPGLGRAGRVGPDDPALGVDREQTLEDLVVRRLEARERRQGPQRPGRRAAHVGVGRAVEAQEARGAAREGRGGDELRCVRVAAPKKLDGVGRRGAQAIQVQGRRRPRRRGPERRQ